MKERNAGIHIMLRPGFETEIPLFKRYEIVSVCHRTNIVIGINAYSRERKMLKKCGS
jgi:hypothetical protein